MTDLDVELDAALQALKDRYGEGLATESPSIARLLPEHLRGPFVGRLKAERGARSPVAIEVGPAGMRERRAPTDADVDAVLLQARAVLKLDGERWELQATVAGLEMRLAEARAAAAGNAARHQSVWRRLCDVKALHCEAEAPSCGDGCCHEPLGWCRFCGEDVPWPCRTYRVADGKAEQAEPEGGGEDDGDDDEEPGDD
jgi:hypothetical protein